MVNSEEDEEDYDEYEWIWLPFNERERLQKQLTAWYRQLVDSAVQKNDA